MGTLLWVPIVLALTYCTVLVVALVPLRGYLLGNPWGPVARRNVR